jgi:hypothetical protein
MNPTVLGGTAVLLVLSLWWSGRRRPAALLRSTDASAIAALNRAQIASLHRPAPGDVRPPAEQEESQGCAHLLPATPAAAALPQALLLRRLSQALGQDPATRLAALRLARSWGDRATVPLLRRGLRDSDPAVVLEASLAMERFRGRSAAPGRSQLAAVPLPRNVSRTR